MRPIAFTVALCLALVPAHADAAEPIDFNRDIRPILSDNCFECHGPDPSHRKGGGPNGLRLDVREDAIADRGGRFAIVPNDPDRSELVRRILSTDRDEVMPPADHRKTLNEAQKKLLVEWIRQGAPWAEHWAYIPPVRPDMPEPNIAKGNRIDRFIAAKLETRGLQPAPAADRRTLIRRVYFDLIGLPPTPAKVDAFLADQSPDAYDKVIDQLLASPHFGERLAIHWLDLVRYADTVGYHGDQEHQAAPYRDWVIRALNANMPFDRFTAEQLAGDLLPDSTTDQKIASAYNRLNQTTHEGGAQDKEYLAKYAADRVRTTASVWLGATLGCAECHDHKYDPYTQKDFYRFAAFFADIQERGFYDSPNTSPTTRPPEMELPTPEQAAQLANLQARITEIETTIQSPSGAGVPPASSSPSGAGVPPANPSNSEALKTELADLKKQHAALRRDLPRVMITVAVEPRTMRILPRGDWMNESGEVVQPGVPEFLSQINTDNRATRLDLARWLTSPDHPLTARVFVNRLWQLYFGVGLSRVLDDLGSQGEWPTHPDLLDALAVEFIESGWDIKHMIRLMITSDAYRRASVPAADHLRLDPANRYFARQARFRLPAEIIRDNALSVSGLLVSDIGALRSARPYQPKGYYAHLNFPEREYVPDTDRNQYRRGVYMHWQRQFLHPALKAFDAPSREECIAERPVSNTPQQALTLLNDPTFVEASRVFAERILREATPPDFDAQLTFAYRELLSRTPQPRETDLLRKLHDQHLADYQADSEAARELISTGLAPVPEDLDPAQLAAWTSITRTLLNLSESITRD